MEEQARLENNMLRFVRCMGCGKFSTGPSFLDYTEKCTSCYNGNSTGPGTPANTIPTINLTANGINPFAGLPSSYNYPLPLKIDPAMAEANFQQHQRALNYQQSTTPQGAPLPLQIKDEPHNEDSLPISPFVITAQSTMPENSSVAAASAAEQLRKERGPSQSSSKSGQRTPRRNHGVERFICEYCQKGFTTGEGYKCHIRIHTGERPFKCEICDKTFTQSVTLKAHRSIHTGERPYKCPVCAKDFRMKDYLKKHMRTHTGEKPYICDLCEKKYSQRSALTNHRKISHAGIKFEG